MSQKEVTIVGKNNTKVKVTGQEELLVTVSNNGTPVDFATETTLASIDTKLTKDTRTPAITRPTNAGTITAGKYSVSVANVGAADGTLLGVALKKGETINIDAGALNNILGAITYDATGTEFLIITLT